MYTLEFTFQQLMNDRLLKRALGNLIPSEWINELPTESYNKTLAQIATDHHMHWGAPFLSREILECANILSDTESSNRFLFQPLWQTHYDHQGSSIPDANLNTEESVWLFTGNPTVDNHAFAHTDIPGSIPPYATFPASDTSSLSPAVIICPGGGYSMLSTYSEGIQLAARLERDGGYKAFILNYRLAPHAYPLPQMDLARAVMYVRKHASHYHIDPSQILILGSSAGGHLCASEALYHKELKNYIFESYPQYIPEYTGISARPDGVGLLYPVISLVSQTHAGTCQNNTKGNALLKDQLSVDLHMDKEYPPTYAFACLDDPTVPFSNTTRLDAALEQLSVPHLCELFPSGGHGIGLGYATSARYWSEHMISFLIP